MKNLVITCAVLLAMPLAAQVTVQGFVKERPSNNTVPYATVSLLQSDSTLVTGAITDDNGHYTLDASKGKYILQVSYVGYNTVCRPIEVTKSTTIEDTYISETTSQLEEVEIKAQRPLIERQMDKLVLNVAQSAFASGHSGQDILRKAPGVNIDKDGNITVNGKSVEVYIDGRPSYMSGEQLKGLLMGTDATMIDKVEIITNPSSKYDAAGQGGIINIKLKKNKSQGLNGSISGNYAGMYYRDIAKYLQNDYATIGLNYRGAKTYTAFSFTQVYADQSVLIHTHSEQPQTIGTETHQQHMNTTSDYGVGFQYYNMRLSNDFYCDDKNTLGFILQVPIMKVDLGMYKPNNSVITWGDDAQQHPDTLQHINTNSSTHSYSPQHTANLNYTHVFCDSLSRELTINADYNRFSTKNDEYQKNNIIKNVMPAPLPDELTINTRQTVDIYSAKLDFQTAFWKTGMLECGAKWAMSNTFNNMTTDSVVDGQSLPPTHTQFDYSEQVGAVYISAAKQFNEHWNAKLGLRGELTYSKGTFYKQDLDSVVEKKPYVNLFPTVFLGYSPTQLWNMNISYTRRIKRASYYQLNPFVSYIDAHTYECGNPDLQPEFNNQVDLNFSYSRYVTLGFNFAHTQAMHNRQIQLDPISGDIKQTWVNFGTCTTHGGNLSLTELPLVPKFNRDSTGAYIRNEKGKRTFDEAWLTLTVNFNAYHFINTASNDPIYGTQKSWWGSVYACLTAYLPKDCQLALDANWSTPCTNGYSEWSGYYDLNLAFKKQFLDKRLTLTVKVDDILNSMTFTMRQVGMSEGYASNGDQHVRAHNVGIGLTYIFGQQQAHKWRKVGNVDETSRLGSGSGGGIGGGK